jgi:ABC-type amino acid transport substrate-binding protein
MRSCPGHSSRRTALRTLVAGSAMVGWSTWSGLAGAQPRPEADDQGAALARVQRLGRISFGIYNDMPPFHVGGQGIDVDMAQAIAKSLNVEATFIPFSAGENMDDDLRAMVWRGHYLGFGPADVLLHVPVDAPLMNANPRVSIFAPYYRERLVIARDLRAVPKMESMADFKGRRIAVPGQSLAGWLLIGSDSGAYRDQLDTKLADGTEAAKRLLRGDVAAAAGHASEIESTLAGDARFAIEPLPLPRMRDGWPIGCAVKQEARSLAVAIKASIDTMNTHGDTAKIFERAKVAWRKP